MNKFIFLLTFISYIPCLAIPPAKTKKLSNPSALRFPRNQQFMAIYKGFIQSIKRGDTAKVNKYLSPRCGYFRALKKTVKKGARIGKYGATALHWAIAEGHTTLAKVLIEKYCAPINKRSTVDGFTPLLISCTNNDTEFVRYLCEQCHANPLITAFNGASPVYAAAQYNNLDMVKYLIEKLHVPSKTPYVENNPLQVAILNDHQETASYLAQNKECPICLEDGNSMAVENMHILSCCQQLICKTDLVRCKNRRMNECPCCRQNPIELQIT